LTHAKDLLELGHGKLFFLEEEEEAKPGRVGEEAKKING
jgi:hypothetical protein